MSDISLLSEKTFIDLVELSRRYGCVTKDGDVFLISFHAGKKFNKAMEDIIRRNKDVIDTNKTNTENLEAIYNIGLNGSCFVKLDII